MRLKFALVVWGALVLILLGLRVDGLPFFRGDARYSDSVTSHWPNALFLRESILERGEFPVWRETTMAGQPFLANPLNKTAYPLQWLVLIFPPSLHLNLLIVIHLLIAGAGMWLWAKSVGLRTEAAALSAIAYAFAPRMMAHLGAGHLDVVYAMAWWPWLMLSIWQTIAGNRNTILQTGLVAALLLLADVRVSLFAFSVGAIYALIELWRTQSWKQTGRFILPGLLFLLLTASVLVPVFLWQPYTSRAEMTAADAGVLSLDAAHFLGLILPASPSGVETLTYFGLPVLALALLAIVAQSKLVRFLLLGVVLLISLYALGSNGFLWPLLVKLIPALLWFRVPSRIWLVLALWVPLAAGYGFQWLLHQVDEIKSGHIMIAKWLKLTIAASIAVAVAFGLFALLILKLPPDVGLTTLLGGSIVGILLLAGLNGRIAPQRLALVLILLTGLDVSVNAYRWVEWRGEDYWLEPGIALAERLVQEHPDRIYSPTYSLEQPVAEFYHLHLFGGVDPFQLKGIVTAVEQGGGVKDAGYSVVMPPLVGGTGDDLSSVNRDAVIDTQTLATWKVSHVVATYPLDDERLKQLDIVNGVYIYSNLDYKPSPELGIIPDWPTNWPDLPDATTLEGINRTTLIVAFISGASFLICLAIFMMTEMRKIRARTR
ncbi:MAG: hypothetical protein ABI690_23145 [Chloroflexota bacterium]